VKLFVSPFSFQQKKNGYSCLYGRLHPRHERSAARVDGPQIGHQLARHGQRRLIARPALQRPLMDVVELRVPARRQFRRLDQKVRDSPDL
jgi:hypothetical protein